jgi:hypothetical protein
VSLTAWAQQLDSQEWQRIFIQQFNVAIYKATPAFADKNSKQTWSAQWQVIPIRRILLLTKM